MDRIPSPMNCPCKLLFKTHWVNPPTPVYSLNSDKLFSLIMLMFYLYNTFASYYVYFTFMMIYNCLDIHVHSTSVVMYLNEVAYVCLLLKYKVT